ncbi:hypothetical protein ONE63_004206 [Megalurothrips usitatus]|uniref:Fatty acyl-CoA reductase n=1 Tax=Megalurothrips usitatus TaxID=439358 RepID=A0AAV7X7M0_9NEOP|nr:hypothetical protein ONE63_004206 [Megalurothrips usitatus]
MDIDMDVYHGELRRRNRLAEEGRAARVRGGVFDGEAGLPPVTTLMAGKDVLVTGASGFLGRVLLEKLLRSCPGVRTVFLLLRPKRGVAPAQRVRDIVDVRLFDQLLVEQPSALDKLVAVAGDCAQPGLGLAAEDRDRLQRTVAFVYHGAASVRFDDPVEKAVLLNTRGTWELAELCAGMARLEALVHISTAYTNINQDVVEERLYPTHLDWRLVVRAVSDPETARVMNTLGHKLLGFHPNTYTFSKALGEQVMAEAARHLPVIIVRPAVVIGAAKEPFPGWLDTVNSPAALWAAINKGVIRVSRLASSHTTADYMPVDIVAKGTIVAGYVRATNHGRDQDDGAVPVVNMAITDVHPVPGWMLEEIFNKSCRRAVPYCSAIRYPMFFTDVSGPLYILLDFFFHILFGFATDLALRIGGQKPRLLKVYRKLAVATSALAVFLDLKIGFKTTNFWELQKLIHPSDVKDFDFDLDSLDPRKDGKNQLMGILEYAFNERFDREKGIRHIDR